MWRLRSWSSARVWRRTCFRSWPGRRDNTRRQRLADAAQAARPYAGALNQVDKAATAKGEIKIIEAVAKERAAAFAGRLVPELPTELPALRLQGTRKALLMKLEKINADAAARKGRLDGQYLGALAALAAKAEPESALAKQVAAEREALLAGGKADGGGGENGGDAKADKVQRGKNVVVNGDFEKVDADGKPEGWNWGDWITLVNEKGNLFVRFEDKVLNVDGTVAVHNLEQAINIPNVSKSVTVSARLRTKACVSRATIRPKKPGFSIGFNDGEGNNIAYLTAEWSGKNGPWIDIQNIGAIPAGAVTGSLIISNGRCPGQIDFDDIEVTFK